MRNPYLKSCAPCVYCLSCRDIPATKLSGRAGNPLFRLRSRQLSHNLASIVRHSILCVPCATTIHVTMSSLNAFSCLLPRRTINPRRLLCRSQTQASLYFRVYIPALFHLNWLMWNWEKLEGLLREPRVSHASIHLIPMLPATHILSLTGAIIPSSDATSALREKSCVELRTLKTLAAPTRASPERTVVVFSAADMAKVRLSRRKVVVGEVGGKGRQEVKRSVRSKRRRE